MNHKMHTLQWQNSKPVRQPGDTESVVLSRDLGRKGAKTFSLCPDAGTLVDFLEAHRGGSYYEVLEHIGKPCWMYMDIDRALDPPMEDAHALNAKGRAVAETVLCGLSDFLKVHHDLDLLLTLGTPGVEVACASTPSKLSLHVVCHIRMPSVAHQKIAMAKFHSFLRELGRGDVADAIDLSVYGNFRSYRVLGMQKEGKNNALCSVWGSRDSVRHHLVGWYEGISPEPIGEVTRIPYRVEELPRLRAAKKTQEMMPPCAIRGFGDIPTGYYRTVASAIGGSRELKELLFKGSAFPMREVGIDDFVELKEGNAIFHLAPDCRPCCPYAGRVHKKNRLYLYFDRTRQNLVLRCHDDGCDTTPPQKLHCFLYEDTHEEMLRVHSDSSRDTLHTHVDSIAWTEAYQDAMMHPYPLVSQLAIRANMGVGKTEELKRFLKEQLDARPDATVLFVTFSQALSRKYADELEPSIGLESYLKHAHRPTLNQARLVVCLDSLYRYETSSVDFLVMDECTSVLSHLRSDVMQRPAECLARLEQLLSRSRHVIYLDAAIDNMISFRVIRYFEQLRSDKVTWVWNRYVRPMNRTARIVVGNRKDQKLQKLAMQAILSKLEAGERVVVPTSTRSYAKQVAAVIQERYPEKRLRVYHSDVDRQQLEDDLRNVERAWKDLDVLVYSPTVSAGTSFVGDQFDSLVGLFNVGASCPTVDLVLQMLFRIRRLRKGSMQIFIEKPGAFSDLATTENGVDHQLDTSVALYSKLGLPELHAHTVYPGGRQLWDKDRLSYQILRHLVLASNRSHRNFVEVMVRTLREDYDIPTEVRDLVEDADVKLEELPALPRGKRMPNWVPEFKPTHANAMYWKQKYQGEDRETMLLAFERTQYVARTLRVDAELVDERFYTNYVVDDTASHARCLQYTFRTTYEGNKNMLRERIAALKEDDPNFALYRWSITKKYILQLLAQEYLETVLSVEDYERMKRLEDVTLSRKKSIEFVEKMLGGMTDVEAKNLSQLLGYRGKQATRSLTFINAILRNTYGMTVEQSKIKVPKSPGYDRLRLSTKRWRVLKEEYGSMFFSPDDME